MKRNFKNYLLGFAIMLPLIATACSNKDDKEVENPSINKQASVTVSPESFSPDNNAQSLELTVTSNVDWSIRSDASWATVKPSGGIKDEATTIKISIDANKEFDSRTAILSIVSSNKTIKTVEIIQGYAMSAYPSVNSITMSGEASEKIITITANGEWNLTTEAEWLSVSPVSGGKGDTAVTVKASANEGDDTREAVILLSCGDVNSTISVTQLNYKVTAPTGYSLVWSDEFDYEGTPKSDWVIENQNAGWVNNELQTYMSKEIDGKKTLEVKDGFLYVNCFKGSDGKIYSGRMNAKPSTGWQYGYVEARINLPSGKGTWPAFWMMPSNVDWTNDPWPYCGEIDIMEEVGVDKNHVSSSVHTGNYNHTKNTQKTHEMYLEGAEGSFHIYAVEWDEEKLITYVDGKVQLSITKAALGSDHASWPFDRAFYPIVNLAWGGDWGGYAGVDESALPVTMIVDYVRVFQK